MTSMRSDCLDYIFFTSFCYPSQQSVSVTSPIDVEKELSVRILWQAIDVFVQRDMFITTKMVAVEVS